MFKSASFISMRFRCFAFCVAVALLFSTAAPVRAGGPEAKIPVLISFDGQPGATEQAMIHAAGGKLSHTYTLVNVIAAEIPETAVAGLLAHPHVRRIEPDLPMHALDVELDNAWGVVRIGAGDVQADGQIGAGVTIAIIDSGIHYTHPDLDASYAGGYDFIEDDDDPMDVYGHGTHVAGTVAAEDNDNGAAVGPYGVVGVAPGSLLYAVRVLDDAGWGYASDLIGALEWCTQNGIQVVNLSLGWDRDPGVAVAEAFAAAEEAGMVVVAAAGNNGASPRRWGNVIWPARYPSVIAVAATDSTDAVASFSSVGPEVELAAPGAAVFSTWNDDTSYNEPAPVCRTVDGVTECYKYGSGTSMAAPHVAGTAALVIAAGIADANGNGRINDEVRQRLIDTADDLGPVGRDSQYGYGLVNAYAAVQTSQTELYTISGTVTDSDTASAIEGAAVSIAELGLTAVTDGAGQYSLMGVPVGNYEMTAAAVGYQTLTRPVVVVDDSVENWALAPQGLLSMSVSGILFDEVHRGPRTDLLVTVSIQDEGEAAVPGASVFLMLVSDAGVTSFSGLTASDGRVTFTVKKAPDGTYTATVTDVSCSGYTWDGDVVSSEHTVH